MPRTKNVKTAARKPSVKSSSAAPKVEKRTYRKITHANPALSRTKTPATPRRRSNWERPTVAQVKALQTKHAEAKEEARNYRDSNRTLMAQNDRLRRDYQGTPVYRSTHSVHNNLAKAMALAIVVLLFIAVVK